LTTESLVVSVLRGGALTLSKKAGVSLIEASELLKHHRKTYPDYWVWANNAPIYARYDGVIRSVFGWELQVTGDMRDSTLKIFPCQSNGAEILRLACVMLRRAGFDMLCTVHDAILFEFPIDLLDVQVREARRIMTTASEIVLSGFSVSTDVDIYMPGERFLPRNRKETHCAEAATGPFYQRACPISGMEKKGKALKVRPKRVKKEFGLSSKSVYRALHDLEKAELITCERKRGRCARVHIVMVEREGERYPLRPRQSHNLHQGYRQHPGRAHWTCS